MKSLFSLFTTVVQELGRQCQVSTDRDLKTATVRYEHEGLAFLAITLSNYCKDLQKGLSQGWIDRDQFQGFSWTGGLPRFLGGFLDRVFDRSTGRLLDEPCKDSLFALRQITLLFGKIEVPCSDARNRKALQGYIECEQEVRRNDGTISPDRLAAFKKMSLLLFGDVLNELDRRVKEHELVPKHGPGTTADRLLGNEKYDLSEWTLRLEAIFPYGEYCLPNWRYYYRLEGVDFLEPGRERPVKVILVPKSLKTPRVIAVEPTCMQYMQQAIAVSLARLLESGLNPSQGMIGFTDQEPNRLMACQGSLTGELATLDLSEASDRVSNQHVRALVKPFRHLAMAIDATRSRKADVPGHGVIRLAKYASMGSATCFPIESMVFLTVVMLGIQKSHSRQLTHRDFMSYVGQVRVYGDDIIVPVHNLSDVIDELEAFGLKVNTDKSFGTGKFRESCGGDYYDGTDVTPVRVRHVFPSSRQDAQEVMAAVALRNNLYQVGLWSTARWMDSWLRPLLGGRYPDVASTSPVMGRFSYLGYQTEKMSDSLHSPLVRGWVVASTPPHSPMSGEAALLKCLLKRSDEPFADSRHLERSGRPDAVRIKLRWASPF